MSSFGQQLFADRQGATLFAGGVSSPPSPVDHPPTGLHRVVAGGRGGVSALPARAGCSATARRPVRTSPSAARRRRSHPSVDSYVGVKFWTFSDVQGGCRLICKSTCVRVHTVREFSRKIGLSLRSLNHDRPPRRMVRKAILACSCGCLDVSAFRRMPRGVALLGGRRM